MLALLIQPREILIPDNQRTRRITVVNHTEPPGHQMRLMSVGLQRIPEELQKPGARMANSSRYSSSFHRSSSDRTAGRDFHLPHPQSFRSGFRRYLRFPG
jgi:hypothetical protein